MTLESRKLGMLIYGGLAALIIIVYSASLSTVEALGIISPVAIYAFADQIKHRAGDPSSPGKSKDSSVILE